LQVINGKLYLVMLVTIRTEKGIFNESFTDELTMMRENLSWAANAIEKLWYMHHANSSAHGSELDGMVYAIEMETGYRHTLMDWEDFEVYVRNVAESFVEIFPKRMESVTVIPIARSTPIELRPPN